MVTDPIADFITRLRNSGAVGKEYFSVPHSELKFKVAEKLKQHGYVEDVEKNGKKIKKTIDIKLKYIAGAKKKHTVSGVERMSRPGRRMYEKVNDLKPVKGGKGMFVLSTPKGVLSDGEARKENVGGEILFKIW